MAQLRRQRVLPNRIKERGKGLLDMELNIKALQPKITTKDIVVFTRQFATMIDAGLPLLRSLTVLQDQVVIEWTTDEDADARIEHGSRSAIAKHRIIGIDQIKIFTIITFKKQ